MVELINGAVYRKKDIGSHFVLIFAGLKNDEYRLVLWSMLHIGRSSIDGLSSPMYQHDEDGHYCFTEEELNKKFNRKDWVMLDGRLRIEKIDKEMRLVDYTIGGELEELRN